MRRMMMAAALAAQVTAAPAVAADLAEERSAGPQQAGAFLGARLRLPLDGPRGSERLRAGIVAAPALHGERADRSPALRIGEGLEFGATQGRRPAFSLAGRTLSDYGRAPDGTRAGVSTLGWVAIGVAAVVAVVVVAGVICLEDSDCIPSE